MNLSYSVTEVSADQAFIHKWEQRGRVETCVGSVKFNPKCGLGNEHVFLGSLGSVIQISVWAVKLRV